MTFKKKNILIFVFIKLLRYSEELQCYQCKDVMNIGSCTNEITCDSKNNEEFCITSVLYGRNVKQE